MAEKILGDRYIVQRYLGQHSGDQPSGRWTVLALDQSTQTLVVIKILRLDEHLDWDDLKLFEREVEVLRSLSHPAIPRYLDFFEQPLPGAKAIALVRSYVDGESLGQRLQQGVPLSEANAIQVARGLLKILIYLHSQSPPVVHRDIKPGNILVANRRIHLVDFGSVRTDGHHHPDEFTVVGTYGYMPPEQFLGRAVLASDLYSVGVTLTALLTATQPSNFPLQGGRIDFSQMPHLSPELTAWLQWLTEMNLDLRARSAQEALHALESRLLTPDVPVSHPPGTQVVLIKEVESLEVLIPAPLIPPLWGQMRLYIDAQTISLGPRLGLGRSLTAARTTPQRLHYRRQGGESSSTQAPLLTLWVGNHAFELGESPPLTGAELDWLAYELSTWLQVPIQHI
jgi:serine/threonine protein kinase